VPYAEPELPDDLSTMSSTFPLDRRRAGPGRGFPRGVGDTVVVDLVADDSGERDYVGGARLRPG